MKTHLFGFFLFSLLNFSFAFSQSRQEAYVYLDSLALKAGTDKSSAFHNYTKIYAKYFDRLRLEPIKFLEIGIFKGNSVKLWESYFEKASEMHFIDKTSENIEYYSPKAQYHYLDQANFFDLYNFANQVGNGFDLIIDDGGHTMTQQINSFLVLFPLLKSGGLYVIEDLQTSYWHNYGGYGQIGAPLGGPGTCVEFLKTLVDDLNYGSGVTINSDPDKIPGQLKANFSYFQNNIESLHFHSGLCIIEKR